MSNKTIFGEELYPLEKEDNLINFKYSGSDASLLYKYFYGKIAQFLVDKVIPETMA
jgi:hypothetical protein